jgi:hypothetical protein
LCAKETLINSEFPRATDGALADQARKRLIQREWAQAWPEPTTSEPRQDGVVQTFPKRASDSSLAGRSDAGRIEIKKKRAMPAFSWTS